MRIPKLSTVAKKAWERPFRNGTTIFRHVVTVYVDTNEGDEKKVLATVQSAIDEHTNTIQEDGVVEFDEATVISVQRIEEYPHG